MTELDPITGLPKELSSWEDIVKEGQTITVSIERRKFGRPYTIVDGLQKSIDVNKIAKKLRAKLACGGTAKDGRIELQGCHLNRIKAALIELGFAEETIRINEKGAYRGKR